MKVKCKFPRTEKKKKNEKLYACYKFSGTENGKIRWTL